MKNHITSHQASPMDSINGACAHALSLKFKFTNAQSEMPLLAASAVCHVNVLSEVFTQTSPSCCLTLPPLFCFGLTFVSWVHVILQAAVIWISLHIMCLFPYYTGTITRPELFVVCTIPRAVQAWMYCTEHAGFQKALFWKQAVVILHKFVHACCGPSSYRLPLVHVRAFFVLFLYVIVMSVFYSTLGHCAI